jgi:hypothetical protein
VLPVVCSSAFVAGIFAVVNLPVAQMILVRISAVVDSKLDVFITGNVLYQSLLIECLR